MGMRDCINTGKMEIKNFSHSSSFLVLFNVVVEPSVEIRQKRDQGRKFHLTNREEKI